MKIKRLKVEQIKWNKTRGSAVLNPENSLGLKLEFKLSPIGDAMMSQEEVSFVVPETDMSRVRGWFSTDAHANSAPASETLQRNMDAAVGRVLNNYISNASSQNLFTSPFKIMWRLKFLNGRVSSFMLVDMLFPEVVAPYLLLQSYRLGADFLTSEVEVKAIPKRLKMKLNISMADMREVEAIEIYATEQQKMYPSPVSVVGLRSVMIDENRERCWIYDKYSELLVRAKVESDSMFRLLATIGRNELEDYQACEDFVDVPLASGVLCRFGSQPRLVVNQEITQEWQPILCQETDPLIINPSKEYSRIDSIELEGVVDRDKCLLTLFGSQNFKDWYSIVTNRGVCVRGIRGAMFRFYKVRIESEMRPSDYINALIIKHD